MFLNLAFLLRPLILSPTLSSLIPALPTILLRKGPGPRETGRRLLSDADDAAGRTSAGVTGGLALLVPALAEVVGAGVNDDGAAQHALGADQLHMVVRYAALAVALPVRLEVAQVAHVAVPVRGGAVFFAEGVDC